MTDYREDIRSEVLQELYFQFRDKPRFRALVEALALGAQVFEDACVDVIQTLSLSSASGVHLALLGSIVGEQRLNLTEEEYRRVIRAKIVSNRSSGRVSDLLETWRLLSVKDELNDVIDILERYPAGFSLFIRTVQPPTAQEAERWRRIMYRAKGAGIALRLVAGRADALSFRSRASGLSTFDGPRFSSLL